MLKFKMMYKVLKYFPYFLNIYNYFPYLSMSEMIKIIKNNKEKINKTYFYKSIIFKNAKM